MKNNSKHHRNRRRESIAVRKRKNLAGDKLELLECRLALTGSPLPLNINPTGATPVTEFVQVGSITFFTADDGVSGQELWRTDGTPSGTRQVADILPGSGSSAPSSLTEYNGSLLFVADDGSNGRELWISDGTEAGTQLVVDLFPGQDQDAQPLSSSPQGFVEFDGTLFFRATSVDGSELWTTDGTAAGTVQLIDIAPGTIEVDSETIPRSSNPDHFLVVGNQLFFTADDGTTGRELWVTDGTSNGTTLVTDIFAGTFQDAENNTQPNSSNPSRLTQFNGVVYFIARDVSGSELWTSNGTASGTERVLDINSGPDDGLNEADEIVAIGSTLLFAANNGLSGKELWRTDGSSAGTFPILDIQAGSDSGLDQVEFAVVADVAYFAADDGINGPELWRTNGSTAGTSLVENINGNAGSGSSPQHLLAVGDRIFFSANDGELGRELWESDGTSQGTTFVGDLVPGSDGSNISQISVLNETLLVAADDAEGADLWSVDTTGTPVPPPNAIDLLPAADTGEVDNDNVTRLNSGDSDSLLSFEVAGVTDGAIVRIYLGDTIVGTGVASGSTATITTVAGATLPDDQGVLQATQSIEGRESLRSPSLEITVDTVPPAAITNSPPSSAQIGEVYSFDANSVDEGTSGIRYSLSAEPAGMAIDAQTGELSWTPTASQTGDQPFTISLTDTAGNTTSIESTVTVLAELAAVADSYTVAEDDSLNVLADAGVLANDEGAPLSAVVVEFPSNGTVTLRTDGGFTYVPNQDFNGVDTFTYQSNDGSESSNIATVTITVTAENDAPIAVEDTYLTPEDTELTVLVDNGVLANDTDADGDTLTATIATQPSNGQVAFNADGSFVYTPDSDFTGEDSFSYTTSDGTVTSAPVQATIRVASADDPPLAVFDDYSLNEDEPLVVDAAAGVLANDLDPDNDTLTAAIVTQPTNGTLEFNDDGSFTYTPNTNFSGEDFFTYTATDGATTSDAATVTFTVEEVNDIPTASDDTFTAASGVASQTLDVLSNDGNPDGGSLSVTQVDNFSAGGTATISGNQVVYTPAPGFQGTETFDYTIQDASGDTAIATVSVNVADPSVGNTVSGNVYMDDDSSQTRNASEAGVPGVQIDLTGTDTNGTTISRQTITLNDGSYSFSDVPAGTYTITQTQPAALTDGTATTDDDSASVNGNVISNLSVAGDSLNNNFGESDLAAAYHSIVWFFAKQRNPQSRGDVFREVIAIAEEDAGNFELARAIRTGETGDDDGVPGDPDPSDQIPQAVADNYSTTFGQELVVSAAEGVLVNDTDPNGDPLTATVATDVSNGTLSFSDDGSFTYQPNANFSGTDTFTYTVSDGTNTSTEATVSILVRDDSTNSAPVAAVDSFTIDEDQTLTQGISGGVLENDSDADGDTLTATVRNTTTNGTLTLATDGSFTYIPNADFNGQDTFTYVANDGLEDSNEATVTIVVEPVNDPPNALDDNFTLSEDGSLARSAQAGVLANDSDADGDSLTVSLVQDVNDGVLTLNDDGSFTYTPDANFNGTDTFTYEVTDGELTAQATATLTVTASNDPPVAADDNFQVDEDTTLAVDAAMSLLANDSDLDGDMLTAVLVENVANGTLTLETDGTFTYVPNADFSGTDTFRYRVSDGEVDSSAATVSIEVTDVDDPSSIVLPAEFSDPGNVPTRRVGQAIEIDVDVNDVDDDDYTYMLDLEASGIPEGASEPVIDPTSGVISWSPTATGRFAIRVIVVNGDRESNQQTFLLDILASDVDTGT